MEKYTRTNIQTSLDEDRQQILATFKDLLVSPEGRTVKLVNYIKGLPISYDATIMSVDRDAVELQTHKHQLMVIEQERGTCIKNSQFPSDLMAEVQYINVRKQAVFLKNFTYVILLSELRQAVRVAVDLPAEIIVDRQAVPILGKLIDISVTGAAIVAGDRYTLEPGSELMLSMHLPNSTGHHEEDVSVKSTLLKIVHDGDDFRYVFQLQVSPHEEKQLSHFIFQRQVEIIRELKDGLI